MLSPETNSSRDQNSKDGSASNGIVTKPPYSFHSPVGRVLVGRYRLEAEIGAGAMGKVYQAMDLKRRQRCAVKLVRPEADRMLSSHRRFDNEAAVSAQLFHPNIVVVREFNQDPDGTKFMVLELLDGIDLREHLTLYGRLPLRRAIAVLRSVGSALQYAHDLGIVHRDIKPENIFLSRQRSGLGHVTESVKVLDFGLAKLLREPGDTTSVTDSGEEVRLTQGMAVGTPAYLSPEALQEGSPVDTRADQWSLAVVAYQILSGRLPFDHPNSFHLCRLICTEDPPSLHKLAPELPQYICQAIETALDKNPDRRFARISQFVRALENLPPAESSTSLPLKLSPPVVCHTWVPQTSAGSHKIDMPDTPDMPDTLGPVQPELAEKSVRCAHAADLADAVPPLAAPELQSADARTTVQYSADELMILARKSLPEPPGVPLIVSHESPTQPYPGPAVALAEGIKAVSPVAEEVEVSVTGRLPHRQLPEPGETTDLLALRRRRRIPWQGLGTGSALFGLGFLFALVWTAWHTVFIPHP